MAKIEIAITADSNEDHEFLTKIATALGERSWRSMVVRDLTLGDRPLTPKAQSGDEMASAPRPSDAKATEPVATEPVAGY
jgi:hypothetical protein